MQNYAFSSKPPRKKQKFCKTSAKSPEICEIPKPNRSRSASSAPSACPLSDRIGQKNLWESVISVGPSFKIAKCGRTYPKAPYKLLYPVFNNNTVKSSYMLNVFCNHNHIIYDSCSTDNYVSIFNKLTFFTKKSLLYSKFIPNICRWQYCYILAKHMNSSNVLRRSIATLSPIK